jgi:CDP-2,3-bis-(O-geranylgeranyl)-sn-glycerol synthase
MDLLWLAIQLLLLLAVANMTPIGLKRALGARWDWPIDGGVRFVDGRPLLGPSKTWRGLFIAALACALSALLLGLPAQIGALIGALAMAGDALSSFVKRRLGLASSTRATGLDQIPEALLPMLAVQYLLRLPLWMVAGITLVFFELELPLARWSHRHGLREQPY